jgi:hypothetical protein
MTDQFLKLLHSNHVDASKLTNADRRALLNLVKLSAEIQNSGGGGGAVECDWLTQPGNRRLSSSMSSCMVNSASGVRALASASSEVR